MEIWRAESAKGEAWAIGSVNEAYQTLFGHHGPSVFDPDFAVTDAADVDLSAVRASERERGRGGRARRADKTRSSRQTRQGFRHCVRRPGEWRCR